MSASFRSEKKRTWQGRRARGRSKGSPGGYSSHPSLVASWRRFRFGSEHSPLAPPPLRGYNEGGGGVAVAGTEVAAGDYRVFYSLDELRWFDYHGLTTEDVSRETVLRRLQEWDAMVARMLKLLRPITFDSRASDDGCSTSSLPFKGGSSSTRKTSSKSRAKRTRTPT